jgi:hypothetical protein
MRKLFGENIKVWSCDHLLKKLAWINHSNRRYYSPGQQKTELQGILEIMVAAPPTTG